MTWQKWGARAGQGSWEDRQGKLTHAGFPKHAPTDSSGARQPPVRPLPFFPGAQPRWPGFPPLSDRCRPASMDSGRKYEAWDGTGPTRPAGWQSHRTQVPRGDSYDVREGQG